MQAHLPQNISGGKPCRQQQLPAMKGHQLKFTHYIFTRPHIITHQFEVKQKTEAVCYISGASYFQILKNYGTNDFPARFCQVCQVSSDLSFLHQNIISFTTSLSAKPVRQTRPDRERINQAAAT